MKILAPILAASLAIVVFAVAARTQSPSVWLPFSVVMLGPPLAAYGFGLRRGALPLTAGAMYSVAAGLQRLYHPAGDLMFVDQISTAALVALVLPVGWQLCTWVVSSARLGSKR